MTKTRIAMLLAVLLLLCGCQGKPLPAGMEETALTEAGRAVVLQLVQDEYEAVRESFREDVRESVTADQLRTLLPGKGFEGVQLLLMGLHIGHGDLLHLQAVEQLGRAVAMIVIQMGEHQ